MVKPRAAKSAEPKRSRDDALPEVHVEPPEGLRSSRLRVDSEEYVVLSYPVVGPSLPVSLSPSEREVALLVAHGLSNADIARARGVSRNTVANQIASLFRKLGVGSRLELARKIAGRGA